MYACNLYVICSEYSETPWNGKIFDNVEEAFHFRDKSPGFGLYVCKLSDFFWQLREGRPTPRKIHSKDDLLRA